MTVLSVNLNKIALLRNSRGRNYPSVVEFAGKFIDLGVQGITIHPRPDERHITRKDTYELADFLQSHEKIELNIEGYPNEEFLRLVEDTRPDQCTLVPDAVNQLTSDHGWNFNKQAELLHTVIKQINDWSVRSAVFLDPDLEQVALAAQSSCQRIELYTEDYAQSWGGTTQAQVLSTYRDVAAKAQSLGLGVNAGHDLDLQNLPAFLTIPDILEVSIGHALIVECIESGMQSVVQRYLETCHGC
jgi:pyridoxine 5-phosphate synthase